MSHPLAPATPLAQCSRRLVDPEKLKEEIALNLKLVRGEPGALKDQATDEAFKIVASLIVDDMVRRGYQVTALPPAASVDSAEGLMGCRPIGPVRPPAQWSAWSRPETLKRASNRPTQAASMLLSSGRSTCRSSASALPA